MKKTYTDTTMIPKGKGSTSVGVTKASAGGAGVTRIPIKEFNFWMGRKKKQVTLPTGDYEKSSVAPYSGVQKFTDNCTY